MAQQITKKLVNESIDYILRHLNENLTVKDVAGQFHYSEFYFNRLFKAETGESVAAFINRLKMDQSAVDLKTNKDRSITDIGLDYGYTPSNFSSAFKKSKASSPAQFRKAANTGRIENPFCPERIAVFDPYDAYHKKIEVKEIADIAVLYERMIGNYFDIKEKWIKMMADYKNYLRDDAWMIERFYSDPSITSRESCICDLCISVDKNCALENAVTIKGGRFAVYRYEGKIADIFSAVQGVFRIWLPKSGYEMEERYGLNIYRKIDLPKELIVMDLCIPIK